MVFTPDDNAVTVVEQRIRAMVAALPVGAKLPSVRALQQQLHAGPATIQRAVQRIARDGLVEARPGAGTFVTAPWTVPGASTVSDLAWQTAALGPAPAVPGGLDHLGGSVGAGTIVLDNGFPDPSLHPVALLGAAASRAARRSSAWTRVPPEGVPELRALFAAEIGGSWSERDVVITPGAQAGLDSVFRTIVPHGSAVIMEEPCYPGAIAAATLAGLRCIPVPLDADGMRTDLLERVVVESGARLVVVQPRHSNPTGSVMSMERRAELLELAHRLDLFVLEDDWVRDLDLDPQRPTPAPLATMDPHGHVIYLRSLSKVVAPGLRVAGIAARGPALARLRSARLIADFFVSPLLQLTAIEALTAPGMARHLTSLRAALRRRRDVLCAALGTAGDRLSFDVPRGGVSLWVRLGVGLDGAGLDDAGVISALAAEGVRVGSGRPYFLGDPPANYVRMAFAAAPEADLVRAANALTAVVA